MLTPAKAFLFLITFILPFASHAAGLGRLSVTSAPGQPFTAEIDLVAVKKEEKSSLSARLAPQETFRQANVDYLPLLSTFKASIETRPDGVPYVKIASPQVIAEPLLNMLIELNWSSGRLLREYTVVLAQQEGDAPPTAKPAIQAQSSDSAKGEPAIEKGHGSNASNASIRHDEKMPVAELMPPTGKIHAAYGPVKQGDTLGGIAKDIVLPSGASFNQMLVALHRANRDAFIDGNMHQLKAGPVLQIPDSNEIAAISPAEANQEVQVQTADWNRRRFPVAGAAEELKQTVTGEIDRTVEVDSIAARESAKEVLKLSKGAEPWDSNKDASNMGANLGTGSGPRQSEQAGAQARLEAVEEDIIAKSRALREANERIALLEKNIKELQQLLELKNLTLAEMQNRAEAVQPVTSAVSVQPAAISPQPESGPEAVAVAQPSILPSTQVSSSGIEADDTEQAAASPADPASPQSADEPVEIAKPVQWGKLTPEPIQGTDAGARVRPRKGTGTIIDDLVANFEYLGGALVLLITGIVGVSMVRAPKSSSLFDSDEDSISNPDPSQPQGNAREAPMSPGANAAELAHEGKLASLAERNPGGAALDRSDPQSIKIVKEESGERNTHWHEIINKIDLARAYQEMDDKDAARQILQEVLQEGDARQQESARLMLGNL